MLATISIGIDPDIDIGPFTPAWHGITIALGVLVGGMVAVAEARRRGLDPEPISTLGILAVVGALVGGRAFYLLEHGGLAHPGEWLGSRGFTFYGGFIAATLAIGAYCWRHRLSAAYLDAVAPGLAFGYAIAFRRRSWPPRTLAALVVGLLAAGRFLGFFVRSDSAGGALGLEIAQWVSAVLVIGAVAWIWWLARDGGERNWAPAGSR